MRLFRILAIAAVLLAAAAFFSKPGEADVEVALRQALFQRLFTDEAETGRDMLGTAAVIGCRIDPDACFDLLRQGLTVTYDDKLFYARVSVEGFGRRASCLGAFTRFSCPDGFEKAPES